MKQLPNYFIIIIIFSNIISCSKDPFCNTYPCDTTKLTVKDFSNINYRKGTWVEVTNINYKTNYQDTIIFSNDTTWSFWGIDPSVNEISGFFNKKYILNKGVNKNHKKGQKPCFWAQGGPFA